MPPSADFHTPPDAAPTSSVVLPSASTRPAMAEIRPLMAAEPMLRAPSPEMVAEFHGVAAARADDPARMVEAHSAASAARVWEVMRLSS